MMNYMLFLLFTKVATLHAAYPMSLEEKLDSIKTQIKTLHRQCLKVTKDLKVLRRMIIVANYLSDADSI